jgi:hypothetical protein
LGWLTGCRAGVHARTDNEVIAKSPNLSTGAAAFPFNKRRNRQQYKQAKS